MSDWVLFFGEGGGGDGGGGGSEVEWVVRLLIESW